MEALANAFAEPSKSSTTASHVPKADIMSEDGVKLLDTIDKLRELGIDKDIPLPQIIVVGSQSAGKSSVLEAISGIPFPVSSGQCTTFATEIRLRRAEKTCATINIVSKEPARPGEEILHPLDDSTDGESANGANINWDRIPDIIARAAEVLSSRHGHQFSEDILRIEVSGPKQDHLSLIDLPGLFHNVGRDQDSTAPKRVQHIVERYMNEKRAIILAVVSAKIDYGSQ